jgi:WD40 repeat protein
VKFGDSLGVIAVGDDETVRYWDALTGDYVGAIAHGTSVAAIVVDGENLLAVGSANGSISLGTLAFVASV